MAAAAAVESSAYANSSSSSCGGKHTARDLSTSVVLGVDLSEGKSGAITEVASIRSS